MKIACSTIALIFAMTPIHAEEFIWLSTEERDAILHTLRTISDVQSVRASMVLGPVAAKELENGNYIVCGYFDFRESDGYAGHYPFFGMLAKSAAIHVRRTFVPLGTGVPDLEKPSSLAIIEVCRQRGIDIRQEISNLNQSG